MRSLGRGALLSAWVVSVAVTGCGGGQKKDDGGGGGGEKPPVVDGPQKTPEPAKPAVSEALAASLTGKWTRADGLVFDVSDDGTTVKGTLQSDPKGAFKTFSFELHREGDALVGKAKFDGGLPGYPVSAGALRWTIHAAADGSLVGENDVLLVDPETGEIVTCISATEKQPFTLDLESVHRKAAEAEAAKKAADEAAAKKAADDEAAKKAADDEAAKKAEADRMAAEEAAKKKAADDEAAQKADADRMAAEAAAKKAADDEAAAKMAGNDEAAKKAEADRMAAEAAAKKASDDEAAAKKASDEEAAKKAEADRMAAADAAAKKAADDEAAKKAEADRMAADAAAKKAADDAAAKKAADDEAAKKAEADRMAADAAAKKAADDEAAKKAEADRMAADAAAKKAADDAAAKKAADDEAAKKAEADRMAADAAAKKAADDEAAKKAADDAAAKKAADDAAAAAAAKKAEKASTVPELVKKIFDVVHAKNEDALLALLPTRAEFVLAVGEANADKVLNGSRDLLKKDYARLLADNPGIVKGDFQESAQPVPDKKRLHPDGSTDVDHVRGATLAYAVDGQKKEVALGRFFQVGDGGWKILNLLAPKR